MQAGGLEAHYEQGTELFQVPTVRITRRVVGQKTEHKQADKKGYNNVDNNLKRQHENTPNQRSYYHTGMRSLFLGSKNSRSGLAFHALNRVQLRTYSFPHRKTIGLNVPGLYTALDRLT
jgi:hypothetical protein